MKKFYIKEKERWGDGSGSGEGYRKTRDVGSGRGRSSDRIARVGGRRYGHGENISASKYGWGKGTGIGNRSIDLTTVVKAHTYADTK